MLVTKIYFGNLLRFMCKNSNLESPFRLNFVTLSSEMKQNWIRIACSLEKFCLIFRFQFFASKRNIGTRIYLYADTVILYILGDTIVQWYVDTSY
jgi:hypothetical protein